MEIALDGIDRELLNLIQSDFPLDQNPFSVLGQRLGVSGEQALRRIKRLKSAGVIRQIGPLLDAKSLGYTTTLVAVKVKDNLLDKAAQVISDHPGVSHCYQRNNDFNLWFTLALPIKNDIEGELLKLKNTAGADVILSLPALKVFKLNAYFDMNIDRSKIRKSVKNERSLHKDQILSSIDRAVINGVQQELPLSERPFESLAGQLGMTVDELLAEYRSLIERGIMRRFGAALRHNHVGFVANAMVCWKAPSETVELAGRVLASLPQVSHCYERKTSPLWSYNLFAMIHGFSKEECQEIADTVSSETGLKDYLLLFSVREFKKLRVTYSV